MSKGHETSVNERHKYGFLLTQANSGLASALRRNLYGPFSTSRPASKLSRRRGCRNPWPFFSLFLSPSLSSSLFCSSPASCFSLEKTEESCDKSTRRILEARTKSYSWHGHLHSLLFCFSARNFRIFLNFRERK